MVPSDQMWSSRGENHKPMALAGVVRRERGKWTVHEQGLSSDQRSGEHSGSNWNHGAPERGRCECDVQGCARTVGGEIQWIAKDQTMGIHSFLVDRDQGDVCLHTAKLNCRKRNVGVASKKQRTMEVHM